MQLSKMKGGGVVLRETLYIVKDTLLSGKSKVQGNL